MDSPRLKKGLGQHHLRSPALCRPAIEYLQPRDQLVVEVGIGGGVLTRALLDAGASVRAWELDPEWAFTARSRFTESRLAGPLALGIVVGDALTLPWERLTQPFLAAGNLPYNVATPLIDRMLEGAAQLTRAAFLVQLEVAERLVAGPGTKAYGALSVLTQARSSVRLLGRVRPGSFNPPPKVDSAFIGLEPLQQRPSASHVALLRQVVHTAFGQRRKTLRNALQARWPRERVEMAMEQAGVAGTARAEELSLVDFEALLNPLLSV